MSPAAEALDALSRAFAARDVAAALACFVDDDEVIYSGSEVGEVAAGRAELQVLFAALFQRDVAYSWHATDVRWSCRNDLMLVAACATGHARGRGPGADEDFAYRLTGVLSRQTDGWRWLHLHGAEPTNG